MRTIKQVIESNKDRLVRATQRDREDGLPFPASLPIARALRTRQGWNVVGAAPKGNPPWCMEDEDCYNAYQIAQWLNAGYVVQLFCDTSHPALSDAATGRAF